MDDRINLKELVAEHGQWLKGERGAKRLDLRGADLSNCNLTDADLRRANLARVNLERATLIRTNLREANLTGANCHCIRWWGADLGKAFCQRMFAAFVSFRKVNLTGAMLLGADLTMADMSEAIFGDDWMTRLQLAKTKIIPEGSVIGYKRLRGGRIAKLLIPAQARRSNAFGRRCRAEYAQVISIEKDGKPAAYAYSRYDHEFEYRVGETAYPSGFDENRFNDCSDGIHFFLTYEEAEELSKQELDDE